MVALALGRYKSTRLEWEARKQVELGGLGQNTDSKTGESGPFILFWIYVSFQTFQP